MRLLGVTDDKRLPALPDMPTFAEQGVSGVIGSTWAGLLAPAGTDPAVVQRLSQEVSQIVRLPDVKARLQEMGTIPVGSTPAEFASFLATETRKWGDVIRSAGVKAD